MRIDENFDVARVVSSAVRVRPVGSIESDQRFFAFREHGMICLVDLMRTWEHVSFGTERGKGEQDVSAMGEMIDVAVGASCTAAST